MRHMITTPLGLINSKWILSKFPDCVFFQEGPGLRKWQWTNSGMKVINVSNILPDGSIDISNTERYVSEKEFLEKYTHFVVRNGDIVIASSGNTYGKVGRIKKSDLPLMMNTSVIRFHTLRYDQLNDDYLYSFIRSHLFKNQMEKYVIGSAQPNFGPTHLKQMYIALPPLPTQRTIASILSAYDDLIENNTRRITILEEMAQMIYEEWFVKFRFPGHKQAGVIPEKWEMVPVSSVVYINPTTHIPKEGEKAFVPMTSLSNNSMFINNIELREGNSGSKFKNDDTLFARITPCIENGKTGYVQFLPDATSVAFGSTEFIVLRSKTLGPKYVYLMARTNAFRDHAIKSMSGASGRQRVQMACFDTYFVAQPDQYTILGFEKLVSPIFRDIHILSLTNAKLRRTRDLLLPKLISGEIDVSSWAEGDAPEIAQELAASAVGTTNGYEPRIDTIRRVAEAGPIEPMEKDALEWHSLWE